MHRSDRASELLLQPADSDRKVEMKAYWILGRLQTAVDRHLSTNAERKRIIRFVKKKPKLEVGS